MEIRRQSSTWFDVLSFLSLAAVLGLVSGVALGAVALLLAGPAYGADSGEIKEGTLLLRPRRRATDAASEEPIPAPLVSTDVLFQVTGPIARARVIQTFHNPQADWYEGVYVFPLPENAAVDRLRVRVGERLIEGEIRERGVAKQVYDQARISGRRAALLEQERPNIFTTSVANIGPRESVVVEIEYQQTLRYDGNKFSLRFPMVVGPRYIPVGPLRVMDAERITPPGMRPGTEGGRSNPVSIRVELDAGVALADVRSPYHQVDVRAPDSSRRVVSLSEAVVPANRDFELAWSPRAGEAPQAAWFTEEKNGKYFGLLMVLPPAAARSVRLPREVIFVLDTSGSMAGTSIRQAKDALELALSHLAPADRFNVIEFNSCSQALFADARDATPETVLQAVRWVSALEARGGTEMADALKLALPGSETSDRVRQVMFLTDGAVGNEEELFRLIRSRLGNSRLFTVGIGSAPNSHFMTKAAQLGRGTFTYIGRVDEVRAKMGELFAKLETPVLKGLEVRWPEGVQAESWPARVPDLYAGEPLVITAALGQLRGEVRLRGERDSQTWEAAIPLARSTHGSGMGSLWARQKIASLMDLAREGVAEDEIRSRVTEIATTHRLITKYTSFVAVDRTPTRPAAEQLKLASVPTLLPEGWEYDQVFGELPRGATDSRFALATGVLALLLASMLMLLRRRARRVDANPYEA
jgi:Ca-activated chloride channel family protein